MDIVEVIIAIISGIAEMLGKGKKNANTAPPLFVPVAPDREGPIPLAVQQAPTLTPAALSIGPRPGSSPRPPAAPRAQRPVAPASDPERAPEAVLVLDLFRQPQSLAAALVASEILSPPIALRHNHPGAPGVLHQ